MFDWLIDLIDELLDDGDDDEELFVPEPPQRRLPAPEFSPKLRMRLNNQRPGYTSSRLGGNKPLPRMPKAKRPVAPPLWHPMHPHSRLNPNNRHHPFNPYNPNNPHGVWNRHNPLSPNNPLNRHRHMNSMNPFGPNHRR